MAQEDQTVLQSEEEKKRQRQQQTVVPQLDDYELQRQLGEGAFGQVWGAVQKRTGQKVAVKFLHESGSHSWSYFRHELERLRDVSEHPGIVTLIDADLSADPPYFVMPWLARGSLAQLPQRAPLTQVLEWFEQMAAALQFTHEKGILHCDLKPSNVLLDQQGHVRLVDFGQARLHGERGAFGTFGYMPPEQAEEGAGNSPDIRWDIYSLGATVYYLLAGRTPRVSGDDLNQLATLNGTSERLAFYREALQKRPLLPLSVDAELNHLVCSCLELQPARRPASAGEILQDLERRRRNEPLLCRRPWSTSYRFGRFMRKPINRVAVGLSLVLLGVMSASFRQNQIQRSLTEQKNHELKLQLCDMQQERGLGLAVSDPQQALLWWQAARDALPPESGNRARDLTLRMRYHLFHRLLWREPQSQRNLTAMSPSGSQVVSCAPGQKPVLYQGASGKKLGELAQPMASDLNDANLCFSPDSQWLAVYSQGNRVLVYHGLRLKHEWPVAAGILDMLVDNDGQVQVLTGGGATLRLPSASPSGRHFERGGLDVGGGHWDVDERNILRCYDRTGTVLMLWPSSVDAQQQGDRLANASGNSASVFNLKTGRSTTQSMLHPQTVLAVCLSPDRTLLATTCADHTLRLWDLSHDGLLRVSRPYTTDCTALAFSPDSRVLTQSCADGKTRLWDCRQGNLFELWRDPQPACRILFSPNRDKVLLTGLSGGLCTREVVPPPCRQVDCPGKPESLAYQADGRLLVGHSQGLSRWNGRTLESLGLNWPVQRVELKGNWAWTHGSKDWILDLNSGQPVYQSDVPWLAVDFQGDQALAASQSARFLEQLHLPDGPMQSVPGLTIPPVDCAFGGPRFGMIAGSNPQGAAQLDLFPGGPERHQSVAPLNHEQMLMLAVQAGGNRMVVAGQAGGLCVWDLNECKAAGEYHFTQAVLALAYSPSGKLLAACSQDGTARVFSSSDLSPKFNELAHAQRSPITCVAFSPDEDWLATGCADGTARLWDSQTGLLLTSWLVHEGPVTALAFQPDGKGLATAAGDGKLRLWDLSGSGLPADLNAATGMKLNSRTGSITLGSGGL